MPYLVESICTIIGVFHKHAKKDGDCFTLNRRELKWLIRKEFSEVLENPRDPQTVDLVLQLLDLNGDCLVDFSEYLLLIFRVAKACYHCQQPSEQLRTKQGIVNQEKGNHQLKRYLGTGREILCSMMKDIIHHMSLSHGEETEINTPKCPHKEWDMIGDVDRKSLSSESVMAM
ncbi:repetin-like [Eublepharis macularius]|uniref:Repetin-like n=1 Tax=Eublepharis macularius TaxID=481883 RepID=A0AA97J1S4_EUBMA|nr:repetin-like [Eublepharis macularius]